MSKTRVYHNQPESFGLDDPSDEWGCWVRFSIGLEEQIEIHGHGLVVVSPSQAVQLARRLLQLAATAKELPPGTVRRDAEVSFQENCGCSPAEFGERIAATPRDQTI